MKILYVDTETSGLVEHKMPSDDPAQPWLVQIALLLYDGDELVRAYDTLVKPGNVISPEAFAVHGISTERAMIEGIEPAGAIARYRGMMAPADQIVAHGVFFDKRVMRSAQLRAGFTREQIDSELKPTFCTLQRSTKILKLPPSEKMAAAKMRMPKSASIEDCYAGFFSETLAGAHDAVVDVAACRRIHQHLMSLEGVA